MEEIRALSERDADAVFALENDVFRDAYHRDTVLSSLCAPFSLCLGAFLDGELTGYLLGTVIPPEAEILRIAVSPAERRRGRGEALLSAFLSGAGARGVSRTFLEVRTDNLPAVSLYRKCGFFDVSVRKNYYRDPIADALVMRRTLGEQEL